MKNKYNEQFGITKFKETDIPQGTMTKNKNTINNGSQGGRRTGIKQQHGIIETRIKKANYMRLQRTARIES